MANAYKILGQIAPPLTTSTNLYVVPAATEAVISSIIVCNRDATESTYDISVAEDDAAANVKQFIAKGAGIPAADSISLTLGITLSANDVVRCNVLTGNISFSAFGSEIT